jgi:hypothetical protein
MYNSNNIDTEWENYISSSNNDDILYHNETYSQKYYQLKNVAFI